MEAEEEGDPLLAEVKREWVMVVVEESESLLWVEVLWGPGEGRRRGVGEETI